MFHRTLSALPLLFGLAALQAQESAHVAWTETQTFRIAPAAAGYRMSSEIELQETLLNWAACGPHSIRLGEPHHAPITRLRASRNGVPLPADRISFHYPQARDVFINAGKVHDLDFSGDLKPDDRLACAYAQDYPDPALFPLIKVPALDQVVRFELGIEHPAELRVDFSVFQPRAALEPAIQRPDPGHTRIIFTSIPAPGRLPHDPFSDLGAAVLTRITRNGVPLTLHTPEALMAWYRPQLEPMADPAGALGEGMRAELARAATPLEKARLLFDFVKSEVRYVADFGRGHAFIPHSPRQVLEQKWGDCKDKAWLLVNLARGQGLRMHSVLVSTDVMPLVPEEYPGLFDHVICALEDGGKLTFMDPTDPHSAIGDPPDSDLLGRVLVLDPERPRSVVVPNLKTTPDLSLAIAGNLADGRKGTAVITLRHSWRSGVLDARKVMSPADFEGYLGTRLNRELNRISLEGFTFKSEDRDQVVLEAKADLADFPVDAVEKVYLPSTVFRTVAPDLLDRKKDKDFIEAPGPKIYELELVLAAAGLQPRSERFALGGDEGPSHEASCAGTPGTARLHYLFKQPYRLVPGPGRDAFLGFCEQYLQQNVNLFSLVRSRP